MHEEANLEDLIVTEPNFAMYVEAKLKAAYGKFS